MKLDHLLNKIFENCTSKEVHKQVVKSFLNNDYFDKDLEFLGIVQDKILKALPQGSVIEKSTISAGDSLYKRECRIQTTLSLINHELQGDIDKLQNESGNDKINIDRNQLVYQLYFLECYAYIVNKCKFRAVRFDATLSKLDQDLPRNMDSLMKFLDFTIINDLSEQMTNSYSFFKMSEDTITTPTLSCIKV